MSSKAATATVPPLSAQEVPDFLVREVIAGKKYYYKGFRKVLAKEATLEDIMGSSSLQSVIIDYLVYTIFEQGGKEFRNTHRLLYNESGYHFGPKDNLALDIAVYDKEKLPASAINTHYVSGAPPRVVFEVDTQVELLEPLTRDTVTEHLFDKTGRLLEIGTEQVVWVFSNPQKVLLAQNGSPWLIQDWDASFEALNMTFNIGEYLREEGVEI